MKTIVIEEPRRFACEPKARDREGNPCFVAALARGGFNLLIQSPSFWSAVIDANNQVKCEYDLKTKSRIVSIHAEICHSQPLMRKVFRRWIEIFNSLQDRYNLILIPHEGSHEISDTDREREATSFPHRERRHTNASEQATS